MDQRFICGYEVGALVMKSWVPKPPGHISCATNYDFPVYYYPVENTNTKTIHGGAKEIIPSLIEATKELKDIGCNALITSCGYFGHYQKKIAEEGIMPTYLSSVCLIPFIFNVMPQGKSLAIICYNKEKFTAELLTACSVPDELREKCYVYDIINEVELGRIITDCGEYDVTKGREEVVSVAQNAVAEHEDIGAFLLECTDLPPHSFAIQAATNLPVFDSTTMVKFVHSLGTEAD